MGVPGPITLSAADRAGMALKYGTPAVTITSVVTNTLDSGLGSLRAALYFAFDHPGTHVTFNISTNDPGFTNGIFAIQPSDELPWLVNGTFLDGASQPTNASFHPTGPSILINGGELSRPQHVRERLAIRRVELHGAFVHHQWIRRVEHFAFRNEHVQQYRSWVLPGR